MFLQYFLSAFVPTFNNFALNFLAILVILLHWSYCGLLCVCMFLSVMVKKTPVKPKDVEVHFIMPAVLNLISAEAYLPGDILTASNGKTIEVVNTDAEGRLCLCDALVYAETVVGDMDAIVDIATLTGACIVALGNGIAGLWSPSDALSDALLAASKGTDDKFWRMPLPDEYVELLKSKIADFRNIGTGRSGGAITAALFLRQFVKTKEWAHLDIAGTAWNDKKNGATGFGVSTLVKWIETYAA